LIRRIVSLVLIAVPSISAQEYVEEDWVAPPPPEFEPVCADEKRISEPVISYRISETCSVTDVQAVGEYRFGTEQVRSSVRNLPSSRMIRRFVSGSFIFFREIRIPLHKAFEPLATLVCTVDMMEKKVIDAKILRHKQLDRGRTRQDEQVLDTTGNRLPDLGIFTYSEPVSYTVDTCPE